MLTRIAIDGHSASGKSTVAASVARRLGAQVVRPFADEDVGALMKFLDSGDIEGFARRARAILVDAERRAGPSLTVFDRHWVSVLVHLPEEAGNRWRDVPPTFVCWADAETTERRLRERVEHEADMDYHRHFIDAYRGVAERRGLPLIDTGRVGVEEASMLIVASVGEPRN